MSIEDPTFAQALAEFETTWADPRNTVAELPPVDINRTLSSRYEPRVRMTRTQVWDMEVKKAWDPLTYIPYVVSEAESWASAPLPDGRRHWRSSIQKAWLSNARGLVLEDVFTDPQRQRVLFLGRTALTGPDGRARFADPYQPLFHVEHAVGGTESEPLNLWRIVVLTDKPDPRYAEEFAAMTAEGWLPGFLEIYLRHDLGVPLRRAVTWHFEDRIRLPDGTD